jgi:hypothetical protein
LSRCDYSAELEIRRTEGETTDEDENADPITQSGYETLINASGVNLVDLASAKHKPPLAPKSPMRNSIPETSHSI